jgi:hypothetical protein
MVPRMRRPPFRSIGQNYRFFEGLECTMPGNISVDLARFADHNPAQAGHDLLRAMV